MVRFIIDKLDIHKNTIYRIYIPIWLDLLFLAPRGFSNCGKNLHSNMVRFIMLYTSSSSETEMKFTFQYG